MGRVRNVYFFFFSFYFRESDYAVAKPKMYPERRPYTNNNNKSMAVLFVHMVRCGVLLTVIWPAAKTAARKPNASIQSTVFNLNYKILCLNTWFFFFFFSLLFFFSHLNSLQSDNMTEVRLQIDFCPSDISSIHWIATKIIKHCSKWSQSVLIFVRFMILQEQEKKWWFCWWWFKKKNDEEGKLYIDNNIVIFFLDYSDQWFRIHKITCTQIYKAICGDPFQSF